MRVKILNDCIFCKIVEDVTKANVVYENENTIAFFDINPVNEYHTLVIPKNHYEDIFTTPEDDLVQIMKAIKHVTDLYEKKIGIKNIQIINSSGRQAQQDIFHLHFHIVPRYQGDGQDIKWNSKVELREKFRELLDALA